MLMLLDTNILLRFVQPHDPHYALIMAAISRLTAPSIRLCFSPQNLVEFWSTATRPPTANGFGWSPSEAEREVVKLESFFQLLPDTPDIHTEWRRLVVSCGVSGKQVHDARLVAVMKAHGVTHLLTFNVSDFTRFPGITAVHPQEIVAAP
ncbi:MAG: PIN domain-containing protein [Armatimonadetes bacterium]|nr:PIN domain-containing protein [Armatimonadota bacterium]